MQGRGDTAMGEREMIRPRTNMQRSDVSKNFSGAIRDAYHEGIVSSSPSLYIVSLCYVARR